MRYYCMLYRWKVLLSLPFSSSSLLYPQLNHPPTLLSPFTEHPLL